MGITPMLTTTGGFEYLGPALPADRARAFLEATPPILLTIKDLGDLHHSAGAKLRRTDWQSLLPPAVLSPRMHDCRATHGLPAGGDAPRGLPPREDDCRAIVGIVAGQSLARRGKPDGAERLFSAGL